MMDVEHRFANNFDLMEGRVEEIRRVQEEHNYRFSSLHDNMEAIRDQQEMELVYLQSWDNFAGCEFPTYRGLTDDQLNSILTRDNTRDICFNERF